MREDSDTPSALVALPPVTAAGVADIRERVADAARETGLSPDRVNGFTVAVHEIVINAVEHGGGTAAVTLILEVGRLVVEIADTGSAPWQFRVPAEAPPPDQLNGRGLWLADKLSDELTVDTAAGKRLVRLTANADAA
ncbi:ATP-binding protein [Dactylosporangium sp. NPDC000521]|uniref:ATP-binding protein n=1 Tax=Dactylosporangium sp. NPDC000521 TaxID=3363975 RepID=UPI00369B01FD